MRSTVTLVWNGGALWGTHPEAELPRFIEIGLGLGLGLVAKATAVWGVGSHCFRVRS